MKKNDYIKHRKKKLAEYENVGITKHKSNMNYYTDEQSCVTYC